MQLGTLQLNDKSITLEPGLPLLIGTVNGGRSRLTVSDAKRLKELETENARLKRLLAESMLENEVTKEALRKKW
jgi:hypothetical protein